MSTILGSCTNPFELRLGCSVFYFTMLSIDVGIELVWALAFPYVVFFFMKQFTVLINIFGISMWDTVTYSVKYSLVF